MKILRNILLGLLLIALMIVGFVVGMFFYTSGEYVVAETVAQDDSIPHITLDGVTFHAETFGDPDDPTVIVLHGGPGGDYRYLLNLEALSDEFYVVFYDQRGTGLSPRVPLGEHTLDNTLADLDRIVDHYGEGEPVHLVGHSWGAMLASGYVAQHADKVDKLVLAEPGALTSANFERFMDLQASVARNPNYLWMGLRTGFESMHVEGPDEWAQMDYLVGTMAHTWSTHEQNAYNCVGADYDFPAWRWGTDSFNGIIASERQDDGTVNLDKLEAGGEAYTDTVLFIGSTCNTWIGADFQAEQMQLYADPVLVTIEDAGHNMFTEAPERSIPPVRAYLRGEPFDERY